MLYLILNPYIKDCMLVNLLLLYYVIVVVVSCILLLLLCHVISCCCIMYAFVWALLKTSLLTDAVSPLNSIQIQIQGLATHICNSRIGCNFLVFM